MKIGDLAKRTGLPVSTIRFYEAKGLLNTVSRQNNGYREYPPEAIAILSIITSAQQTGFSLGEIKQALPEDISNWDYEPLLAMLATKVEDIEAMELRLRENKGLLLTLIGLIRSRPRDMACKEATLSVMEQMGLPVGKLKAFKA